MTYFEKMRSQFANWSPAAVHAIAERRRDFDPRAGRWTHFSDMLLASGWTLTDGCWIAPAHLREQLAQEVGNGGVYLWVAVAAQIQADEVALCAEQMVPS